MGPILDKALMPLTLATTAEALRPHRPLDAWLAGRRSSAT